jgi:hypothetical protein
MIDRHMKTERANPKLETQTQTESDNRTIRNWQEQPQVKEGRKEGFLKTCHNMVLAPTVPLTRKVEHRNNHRRPATEPSRWDEMPKLKYISNGQMA